MYYKTYWDKKNTTFLILHWWGATEKSWDKVWELLSNNFFVIVPIIPLAIKYDLDLSKDSIENNEIWKVNKIDLENEKENKFYNLDDYAKLINEFIEKLNLKDFILLWHSNGWAIAIKLLTNFQWINVKKLILNNSAWIRKDKKRSFKRKIFNFIAKLVKPIFSLPWMWKIRILFYKLIWGQDYLEAEKNPNKKKTYLNMINEDLQDIIPNIKNDTLLIWWENDTYTPLEDWKKINNLIKNSKMVVINNVRHGIHLRKPEELVKVILDN